MFAPSVKLKLDKKTYTLVEDFNALAVEEQLTGISTFDAKAQFETDDKGEIVYLDVDGTLIPKPKVQTAAGMRARLYSLLRCEHPDLTLEDVGALLHAGNVEAVQNAFQELLFSQLPDKEGEKKSPPSRRRSPGKTSGRSASSSSN